jgi:hypothetical protein
VVLTIIRLVMFNEYHELLVEITLECVAPHDWRGPYARMAESISVEDTFGSMPFGAWSVTLR